jgi:hypothetical protein
VPAPNDDDDYDSDDVSCNAGLRHIFKEFNAMAEAG